MNKMNRVWTLEKINVHLSALLNHVSLCMKEGLASVLQLQKSIFKRSVHKQ